MDSSKTFDGEPNVRATLYLLQAEIANTSIEVTDINGSAIIAKVCN